MPDAHRVGAVGEGWKVANATLSGERQMVAGSGSGGVDRIGGSGVGRLLRLARESGRAGDPVVRQRLAGLWCEEKVREWTNQRVRANARAGRPPGAESSIGKVHGAELNQRVQLLATDLLGPRATAWVNGATGYAEGLPYEVSGMLRSRANTIEGGTSEVNRNIIGERVLGLPREPDPWHGSIVAGRAPMTGPGARSHGVGRSHGEGRSHVIVERRGSVGWLVFDRPDVGNAMNARMMDELEAAWLGLDADPAVRVIVNTGNGSAFQTGLDVAQLSRDRDALREHSRRTRDFELRFTAWHLGVTKPVIAAVNGVCAGAGCTSWPMPTS